MLRRGREVRRPGGQRICERGQIAGPPLRPGPHAVAPEQVEQRPGAEAQSRAGKHLAARDRRGAGRSGIIAATAQVVLPRLQSTNRNSLALNSTRHSSTIAASRRAALAGEPARAAFLRFQELAGARGFRRRDRPAERQEPRESDGPLRVAAALAEDPPRERRGLLAGHRAVEHRERLGGHDRLEPSGATGHQLGRVEGGEHRVGERSPDQQVDAPPRVLGRDPW